MLARGVSRFATRFRGPVNGCRTDSREMYSITDRLERINGSHNGLLDGAAGGLFWLGPYRAARSSLALSYARKYDW